MESKITLFYFHSPSLCWKNSLPKTNLTKSAARIRNYSFALPGLCFLIFKIQPATVSSALFLLLLLLLHRRQESSLSPVISILIFSAIDLRFVMF
ncbi:hypothetical protein AKJ16_DCAP12368 [Drosera capensis]